MVEMSTSALPLVAMLAPLLSLAVIMAIPNRSPALRKWVCVLGSVAAFGLVLAMLPDILDGHGFSLSITGMTGDLEIGLAVDNLGYYFGLVLSFMWVLATLYSVKYIDHKENRFFAFMALCEAFLLGCAFSANMFTYFIFYELMTFGSYPLIVHEETDIARKAAFKYLVYAIFAGAVLTFAIIAHYFWGGNDLGFSSLGTLSLETASRTVLTVIFFLYLAGFGVKAAIMPLHGWVPDAHPAAPAPASALLSGVILKAGAFGIMRVVFNVFGVDLMRELKVYIPFAILASITIVLASVFAITQDNLKRRLAYSSIGQVSYILLGLALLTRDGALGGMMHLAHHAIMKGCLFLCAGIIVTRTGKKNVSEMKGIGYQLPLTMLCFSLCALAMMGTPPTVGFVSKWLLGNGALEAGEPIYLVVLLTSSLLNAVYFLPIIYAAFFQFEDGHAPDFSFREKTRWEMLAPVMLLALLVLVVGIWIKVPGFPYTLVEPFVNVVFP
jgi:multicomponent Na+:H+ antiporter subunit D